MDALTSYTAKGKSLLFGEVGAGNPSEIFAKSTGQVATFVHQQEGDVVRAFDGTTAWWQIPLTVTPQYPLTARCSKAPSSTPPWRSRGRCGRSSPTGA